MKTPSRGVSTVKSAFLCLVAIALLLAPQANSAGWLERLGLRAKKTTPSIAALDLSQEQIVLGLKEALRKGVDQAIASLGKPDGFLKDLSVRIPPPAELQQIENTLRFLRQDQLADDFVAAMNRAAEKAVPQAAAALAQALQQMTLTDAKSILTGPDNAATQFFRRTSETNLYARLHPIVVQTTAEAGVTRAFKSMLANAGFAASFLGQDAGNLDAYITQKALDGLFLKIAIEEKRIRENPVARTTDLLRKVFGPTPR